jgi:tRNA 2-thiouridine synthesizing protein A
MIQIDLELDTIGLMCPLPLLRLKKALQSLTGGQIIRVVATDPASVLDFGVFVEQAGHHLLEQGEQSGTFYYLIRKSESRFPEGNYRA